MRRNTSQGTAIASIFSLILTLFPTASLAQISGTGAIDINDDILYPHIKKPDDAREHGLESLHTVVQSEGVPLPSNLDQFIVDKGAALVLGKALFHEMSIGSDGVQSCATCHFQAGADVRSKNQLNPDLLRVKNQRSGDIKGYFGAAADEDVLFEVPTGSPSGIGPNYDLVRSDFPFVRDIGNGSNVIQSGQTVDPASPNSNDVASSQGVFLTDFVSIVDGAAVDNGIPQLDPIFNVPSFLGYQKLTTRRVEPRNTPTTINAVFNFANFWDGRANNRFNGENPFGRQSLDAKVFVTNGSSIWRQSIELRNASLASQAVGPPLSHFEMSFGNGADNFRFFPEIGRKLLSGSPPPRALVNQAVDPTDSVLGPHVHSSGLGIDPTYAKLIESAFASKYWKSNLLVKILASSRDPLGVQNHPVSYVAPPYPYPRPSDHYTLMEANFALFWGIAIMMYEATLVSDQTPFDQWMENGNFNGDFSKNELAGLNVFVGKGQCVNCHGGPELTNASVRNAQNGNNVLEPMLMGDKRPAIYDNGFYNIGVTPTTDDISRGAADPWGRPLSWSRQFLFQAFGVMSIPFPIEGSPIKDLVCNPSISSSPPPCSDNILGFKDEDSGDFHPVCQDLNYDNKCGPDDKVIIERVAVDGAFKTPGLRNQELMGPYMHNGSLATLWEVVDFYDRGGNFCRFNCADLDPDIQQLNLSDAEKEYLVSFLLALTDKRVRHEAAPFDHPAFLVPNGHPGSEFGSVPGSSPIQAADSLITIPAVGAGGGPALLPFLNADPFSSNFVDGNKDSDGDVRCSPNFNRCRRLTTSAEPYP